jgi:hypothetical protein
MGAIILKSSSFSSSFQFFSLHCMALKLLSLLVYHVLVETGDKNVICMKFDYFIIRQ